MLHVRIVTTLLGCSVLACMPLLTAAESSSPTWTKPDVFWYRRAVSGGHVWMMVDVEHGVRSPLFDHQRLAIELNLKTGRDYTPLTLPFAEPDAEFVVKHDSKESLMPGGTAIEFVLDRKPWRCELELKWSWSKDPPTDYECSKRSAASEDSSTTASTPLAPTPVVSPDGRWEAFVQDHNVMIRALKGETASVRRLSSDGIAAFAYQPGSIRWSSDGTSLTAYRVSQQVWLSDSLVVGSVKDLIVKGQWAVIQDHW
jgi:hypothetical protein